MIHEQTANVLDNINKRLNEEEKGLRTYRRALAFSKVLSVVIIYDQFLKYFVFIRSFTKTWCRYCLVAVTIARFLML